MGERGAIALGGEVGPRLPGPASDGLYAVNGKCSNHQSHILYL